MFPKYRYISLSNKYIVLYIIKWSTETIGWHKEGVNEMLLKYLDVAFKNISDSNENLRVLVPLCGKTVDMKFLAQNENVDEVYGVDGILKALEAFSAENPELMIQSVEGTDHFDRLSGNGISLLRGDFFALNKDELDDECVDVVWDRASFVAIKPEVRGEYLETVRRVIKPGGVILMVTVDRREGTEEAKLRGPPFSVNEEDLHSLYGTLPWIESIEKLDETDVAVNADDKERLLKQGMVSMFEVCFLIRTKK